MIEPHSLAQHPPTTICLGHLDELHYVSTAAVTCGSDAYKNPQRFTKHRVNDPQRSASSTAHAMQQYTKALQIPRGPPRKSRTVRRKTAGRIGLSLTLP